MNPLRWWTKAGYGAAEFGLVSVEVLIQVYLLKFYNVTVGLSPVWTGTALAIGIIWDAISDPLMGRLSDRSTLPGGRRRPFLLPGAFGMALFFIVLYNPPAMTHAGFQFFYLLFSYLFFNTFVTIISVPHLALGGELSTDPDERTEVFAFRRLFSTFGLVLGTVLPALILKSLGGAEVDGAIDRSRGLTAWLLAIPVVATAWLSWFATRNHDRPLSVVDRVTDTQFGSHSSSSEPSRSSETGSSSKPSRSAEMCSSSTASSSPEPKGRNPRIWMGWKDLFISQREVWQNRLFLPLLIAVILAGVGRTLNGSVALYYYEYRLKLTEEVLVLQVLLPFFLSLIAFIPLWIWLSRRFGKKVPAILGVTGLGLQTVIIYPLAPPGVLLWPLVAALTGGLFSGAIVLLDSLVPDVVDFDELKTGESREGLYFGVWRFGGKLARAFGLLLAGVLLGWTGFDETLATQSETTTFRLSLMFGPGVGVLFLAAAAVFAKMPMDEKAHQRVQEQLRARR